LNREVSNARRIDDRHPRNPTPLEILADLKAAAERHPDSEAEWAEEVPEVDPKGILERNQGVLPSRILQMAEGAF
jgi:hypothetical protein